MTRIDPNALRLAGAYQTAVSRKPASPTPSTSSTPVGQSFDSLRRADSVVDQVAIARPEKLAASVSKLSAATVAGSAVKTIAATAPAAPAASTYTARGTLSMYGQPGERNTAATGVAIGRVLDAQG
jgi:hypothetical protein